VIAGRTRVTLYSDAAYYGGAEVYLSMLARHLDRERFELSALVPSDPPVERLESELLAAGASLVRHERPGFRWWEAVPRLRRALAEIGGEVLHINLPSAYDACLSSVALAAKLAGYRRAVTTEHLPMIRRRYRKFPGKVLFGESLDAIIVPARATRTFVVDLHRMPWEKTRIIPYGVEEPEPLGAGVESILRERTDAPRGTLILGIVGRLTERKGHRYLLEALTILGGAAGLPAMRVWVIGEGEDREKIEEMIRARGLGEIVRLLGPRADAAALMPLLDLLVVPSLMETTPFVILEAMAAGRAVVASSIYGIPEMIEEGESGSLVEPGDAEGLARALSPLIADRALRERFGRRGRERYEATFSADRMARATEAVYLARELEAAA
jgi:glycosyltransferase involved in cell wall biosynthesis